MLDVLKKRFNPQGFEKKVHNDNIKMQEDINSTTIASSAQDDSGFYHLRETQSDLVKWQQDFDNDLEVMKHDLAREIPSDEGGWVREHICTGVDKEGKPIYTPQKPLVNRTGVYRIVTLVKRFLNRSCIMTNFDTKVINDTLYYTHINVAANLASNLELYQVRETDLSLIMGIIMTPVKATIYRALNNGERKHLSTINKRIETVSERVPEKQRKGLFGM